ncbi:MAG TPA: YdcF family protein [Pyrinomonadaceae bacterium]|nr:YdcF family protein [Pyrinomonadaceae bacterium]
MTPEMDNRTHTLAEKIWRYHHMDHQLEKADAILVLCSHDKRVAETGAQLFLEGWAPLLIFAGGLGVVTREMWTQPEADQFAEIAIGIGVPSEKILIENRSSNTGENIMFTRRLLEEKQINPQRFILVQKPYMERRSFATFKKVWPEKEVLVTSPQVSFEEYLREYTNQQLSKDDVISIMVGDLQRIKLYPMKGFQIHQEIPVDVWSAYEELVKAGYDQRLVE